MENLVLLFETIHLDYLSIIINYYCIYNAIKGMLSLANTILYEGYKQQGNCVYFLLLKGH